MRILERRTLHGTAGGKYSIRIQVEVKSDQRRGTILNGVKSRIVDCNRPGTNRRIETPEGKVQLSSDGLGKNRICREEGVRPSCKVVVVLGGFCVGWVSDRPTVIVERKHWKQDDDEQEQARERHVSSCECTLPEPTPKAHTGDRHKDPDGMEYQLQAALRNCTEDDRRLLGKCFNYVKYFGTGGSPGPYGLS